MAGEGKNQVASSLLDLQPTAVLEFFQIFPDPLNLGTNRINFHGGTLFGGVVTWQGVKYIPTALEAEGFETYGDKRLARPTLRIANENYQITRLLQNYKDLINAHVVRKRVFLQNIDDVNFDGGNPFGTANPEAEISAETWLIGQKLQENKVFVEFELNSPLDLESFNVNYRSIIAKYCYWQYRGEGCRYEGLPLERDDGELFTDPTGDAVIPTYRSFTSDPLAGGEGAGGFFNDPDSAYNENRVYVKGDITVLANNKILIRPYQGSATDDPVKLKTVYVCVSGNSGQYPDNNPTYWQKDGCTKKLAACRKRFNDFEKLGFYQTSTLTSGFKYMSMSGTNNLENFDGFANDGDDGGRAGAFHTLDPAITGIFTPSGEWTVAGWAKTNLSSSPVAGILSTTKNTGYNGRLYDFLNICLQSGGATDRNLPVGGFFRSDASFNFGALDEGGEEIIGPLEQVEQFQRTDGDNSVIGLGHISVDNAGTDRWNEMNNPLAVYDGWYFYSITNGGVASVGPPPYAGKNYATNLKAFVGNGPILQDVSPTTWLFKNETTRSLSGYVPSQFMLGAIPYNTGSGHASMNGQLGPWAVWNRALKEEEIDFLYKDIENPIGTASPINHVPRPFEDCTGLRTGITGVINGSGLVAWWDMTTGEPVAGVTGLVDKTENNHFLTGSGFYGTGEIPYMELNSLIYVNNPTTPYPRFGGYPGTDGFGYGA